MSKNGVLLVEFANQLREEGMSVKAAVYEAAIIRARPIIMTVISTAFGALPLILSSGAGAEARYAIGWVIFGGLSMSFIFTLFLTPVIYLGLSSLGASKGGKQAKTLEEEVEEYERNHAARVEPAE